MYIKISLINLGYYRPFASPTYRPVFRVLPTQPEWQRLSTDSVFELVSGTSYKYTFTFEALSSDSEHYFAYSTPYPYCDIMRNMALFEKMCPYDSVFHREVLTRSIDGREVELVTISNKSNFLYEREDKIEGLFPSSTPRAYKSLKPVIFISSRVHPGETPASFMLDGILLAILGNDSRGAALRSNFVFKVIPVLNPDGVYRGNFRVDQNGVNLNRCYLNPSLFDHPSIYGAKHYFLSLKHVRYYFDLHAHNSKRSCFLFGNFLGFDRQPENQIYAKLVELNTQYFEFNECDFSERSMSAKDPKDHHSKEGSGRVALFHSTGIIHTYTVECSYYMTRPLHTIVQTAGGKSGKRFVDSITYANSCLILVHNRQFFNDVAVGMMSAALDLEGVNPNSRIPLSEFRNLDAIRDYLKARNLIQNRIISKSLLKCELKKNDSKASEKAALPKLPIRKIHRINIVTPNLNSAPQALYQKPRTVLGPRVKSLIRD